MGRRNRAGRRQGCNIILGALTGALFAALPVQAASDEAQAGSLGPELYRWVDRAGVVRYTPDLSRIPDTRRQTAVRVIPGSAPTGSALSTPTNPARIPTPPTASIPQPPATPGSPQPDADPFNAPTESRNVQSTNLLGTSEGSWPELDARIAELELLVEQDEEIIKVLISAPPAEDYDGLIHSEELREVAARLPLLQGELEELKRWRDDSDQP